MIYYIFRLAKIQRIFGGTYSKSYYRVKPTLAQLELDTPYATWINTKLQEYQNNEALVSSLETDRDKISPLVKITKWNKYLEKYLEELLDLG